MKIRITLKDPDGVYGSIQWAANNSVKNLDGLDDRETEGLIESRRDKIFDQCSKWIKYQEYVTIEIDTENGTAIVCEV